MTRDLVIRGQSHLDVDPHKDKPAHIAAPGRLETPIFGVPVADI
jgi:hypothetical protein